MYFLFQGNVNLYFYHDEDVTEVFCLTNDENQGFTCRAEMPGGLAAFLSTFAGFKAWAQPSQLCLEKVDA